MGFLYDFPDTVPTSISQMSCLSGFTTGPVWSGADGTPLLSVPNQKCPPGALCSVLDVNRAEKMWYPFVTPASLTTDVTVSASLGNMYVPARLVVASADGVSTTVLGAGRVYAVYSIDVIEPIVSTLNA